MDMLVSRRGFIGSAAAGSLVIGWHIPAVTQGSAPQELNAWVVAKHGGGMPDMGDMGGMGM